MRIPKDVLPLLFWILMCAAGAVYMGETTHAQSHGTQYEETPAGSINGVNATFTIEFQPLPWASIKIWRNGSRLKRNLDYTLTGPSHTQLVFTTSQTPQPGDVLMADYTY